MQLSRLVAAASTALLTATLAFTGAGAAHAAPTADTASADSYVALGDSYSSGVGSGDYDSDSGDCKRSKKAYPELWAAENSPANFSFTACSGARTGDVLADQLDPLDASTDLVSISIGGNDAGFADTMSTCVLHSEATCLDRIDEARAYVEDTLPGKLDQVYDAIESKAPSAHVVVLGYPHFYQLDGSCAVGLSEKVRSAVNGAADLMNSVTEKRAADHGFTFGDVSETFTGHEICSDDVWLHSVTLPVDESYHPTAAGQAGGYLPVLRSAA